MLVTYVENGVRNIRHCDMLKKEDGHDVLIYRDIPDDFGEPQYRKNVLDNDTVIEKVVQ